MLSRGARNPRLRRIELGFVGFNATECGEWIAVLVYAYERGGTTVAALFAALQLAPCAFVAPVLAAWLERQPNRPVLAFGYVAQAAGMAATAAAMLAGSPALVVYGVAILAALAFTATRPAQAALLPGVVRTPAELTAANVLSNWAEGAGVVGGPLLVGVVIGSVGGPGGVLVLLAGVAAACAVLVWPIRQTTALADADEEESLAQRVHGGVEALREDPNGRLLFGLVGSQGIVLGALDLLCVLMAYRILGTGRSGVGFLNAAFGFGGIVGAALAVMLVCRRRLAPPLLVGVLIWGAAFAALGLQSAALGAYLLLGLSGAARSIVDVSGRSLLQRVCSGDVLARVFGLLEGLDMAAYAAGSLIVPLVFAIGGPRAAVIVVGLVLPFVTALGARRLLDIDAHANVPIVEIGLLRHSDLFRGLPAPELEALARDLDHALPRRHCAHPRGRRRRSLLPRGRRDRRGEPGGAAIRVLGRGEGFGEIALLRDVPRTATVTAVSDVDLYALSKHDFLTALTGHDPTRHLAERLTSERLASTHAAAPAEA